jgi:DNA-binding CsgD family transcriptional regulator
VLEEIADIAVSPGGPVERARALLTPLRRIAPHDAAFITAFDPERRVQTPLAHHGYTAAVVRALDSPQCAADVEQAGMQGPRPPMRVGDLAVPVETLPTWSQHMYPAGIRQCLGLGLFAADGRYLGVTNINSADPRPANNSACRLLARAAPWIAYAIDPLRTVGAIAGIVADAVAGVVLTRGGGTVAVAGLPPHALLTAGSPVLAAAGARAVAGPALTVFLCPDRADDAPRLMRVSVLTCPPVPPGHLYAVVLLSPAPPVSGLTEDDLRLLGLLVAGWPAARIGAFLGTTAHKLAEYIDHVVIKLAAPSREAAAVRALRRGLYIPAELSTTVPTAAAR